MTKFKPIGDQPRWKYVYDLGEATDYGELIPYKAIEEQIGGNRKLVYQAVRDANGHLREQLSKMLVPVPNEGYRVAHPSQHLFIANAKRKQASRRMSLALDITSSTNRKMLNQQEVDRLDVTERGLALMCSVLRQTARKVLQHEKAIADLTNRMDRFEKPNDKTG